MVVRNALLGLLLAFALAFFACGDDDNGGGTATPTASVAAAHFPVRVSDDNGAQVTFLAAPKRIVALAPSFTEVLFAIGAGDELAAVDENTDYPPQAASLQKISGFNPSLEGIAAQSPDLVLMLFDPGGLEDALKGQNIPVLFLKSPATLIGVYDQIRLLGDLSGHPDEALALIARMKDDVSAVTGKISDVQQGPRVYHEVDNTFFSAGPGSFIADLYQTLRAQNIADATGQAFPQLSQEAIISADPEVIVIADEDAGESPDTVASRSGWAAISAVKNHRVYAINPGLASRPGPRIVDALKQLAKYLYPDRFP